MGQMQGLYAQFVQLREAGQSREQAWSQIRIAASSLPIGDQQQLSNLLRQWEMDARQPGPGGAPAKAAEQRQGVTCPNCNKINRPEEAYCYSCGMLLRRAAAPALNATTPLGESLADTSYFDDNMALYFKIQGSGETIRVQPRANEIIIGRKSPESVMVPDVDLAPFGAGEKGVSRFHAGLRRQDNTLVLTDLDSRNHTHVNGQRLHTHEVRVLHDGDELRLGRLMMRVFFGQG